MVVAKVAEGRDVEEGPIHLGGVDAAQLTADVELKQLERAAVVVGIRAPIQLGVAGGAQPHQVGQPLVHAQRCGVPLQIPVEAAGGQRRQQGEQGGEVVGEAGDLVVVDEQRTGEYQVSVRLGVRVWKNDLGSSPTQRAAVPKAFVDVFDG